MSAIPSSFILALGWSLFDFLWQGALVGLAASVVLTMLRNARPQTRYAASCAALALCVALPLIGLWRGLHVDAAIDASPAARFVQFARTADVRNATFAPVAPGASWQSNLQQRLPWMVALWSIGASLLSARMALGLMWVARAGDTHGMPDAAWQQTLDRLAGKIGVACAVRLRLVADLTTPVAAGCWKPVILVPAALIAGMPPDLVEALLAHELAHIRRHDYLVNLVQSAACALLFYHPVVWWLSSRIRIEREQVADDLAAAAIGEPRRLALALHELDVFQDHLRRSGARGAVVTSNLIPADGGHLMSRIRRLVRPNHHALSWKMALPIFALAAGCLAARPHDSATPATPAASATPASPASAAVVASSQTPAMPAVIASSPAPVTPPQVTEVTEVTEGHGDTYALIRAGRDGITMSGNTRDIPRIERARRRMQGDFLWLRRAGRTYVVQDPAVIAKALAVWKTTEPIEKQMQALEEKMSIPERNMEALEKRIEALGDDDSPAHRAMEGYEAQMDRLRDRIEALRGRMEAVGESIESADAAEREALRREMEQLQAKMEPLSSQMEKLGALMRQQGEQIQAAQEPIEQLRKQMAEESKPMEALSKQMETLSKQEEQLSREAERKMHTLIEEAMRAGKATPIDDARP